jgi:Flp pilus assembly protein TadG
VTVGRILRRARGRLRSGGAGDRGSSVVELAILAPMLLLVIWMTIQYALYFDAREVALDAAQTGARLARQYAESDPGGWQNMAESAAKSYYNSLGTRVLGTGIQANAYFPPGEPGEVRVTVTGDVASILLGVPVHLSETSGGPVECFRPNNGGGQEC